MRLRSFTLHTPMWDYNEIAVLWENVQRGVKPMPVGMQSPDGMYFRLIYQDDLADLSPQEFYHAERGRMH